MREIKDQEHRVRANIAVPREALFQLDEVERLIKWRTPLGVSRRSVSRSKLIEIAASLFFEVKDKIDYEKIDDIPALRRELLRALVDQYEQARPPSEES